ncbi:MAG: sulfite exporter TauE/SafE family protein [Candidatus Thorarchaeota archaeon]
MYSIIQVILFTLIGLAAGLMSGIFGIGGGSVRIPLLNLAGLPLLSSFGTNLFVIPFSSAVGARTHRHNIDFRLVPYVICGGISGSVLGALLTGLIPSLILAILFVILAILTIIGMYFDRIAPKIAEKIKNSQHTKRNIVMGIFSINLATGMRGGSGGSLFPSFLKMTAVDIHKAIATSLFATIFTALFAVLIYWLRGDLVVLPTIFVLIGSLVGAKIGSGISLKAKPTWLEAGLSILVVILSLIVLYKAYV